MYDIQHKHLLHAIPWRHGYSLVCEDEDKFHFDWKSVPMSGQSAKDAIWPTSFDFRDPKVHQDGQQQIIYSGT